MDPASTTLKLIAALVLIGINAFFVAAEQSLTLARPTRLEPLAKAGDRRAARLLAILESPGNVRTAAQLGAALATLGVGLLAFSAVYGQVRPRLDPLNVLTGPTAVHLVGVLAALLVLALLHVVLGTQLPRRVAMQKPEQTAGWTLPTLRVFAVLAWPLLRVTGVLGRLVGASYVVAPPLPHTAEELRLLVEQGGAGAAEDEQEQMLLGVIQFNDTLAREVMTPRRDIIALPATATRAETLALAAEEGHSRIPVYNESIDDVIGVLLVKDLLTYVITSPADSEFDLCGLVREPYFVPDTKRIGELLPELRTRSVHMAIVLDEFGGTDGLITLEDMLEEIVGDIFDEHDIPEEEEDFAVTESGDILIDGSASIFDVNERFGLSLPEKDYDTIGGYVFGELGRVPVPGDIVALNGAGELCVDQVEDRRVTRVRLIPAESAGPAEGHPPS
jgi:putative hemolysin